MERPKKFKQCNSDSDPFEENHWKTGYNRACEAWEKYLESQPLQVINRVLFEENRNLEKDKKDLMIHLFVESRPKQEKGKG